jgi:MFS family permease
MRIPQMSRNQRPVIGLLAANAISQFGNMFSLLAIPWFVLETTGSASQTGITVAVGVIPFVLVGIFGGSIVDRLGYKPSSIVADLLSGLSVLMIPLLYETVGLAFWQLLVLVFLGAMLDGPGITARQALFPEIVESAGMSLDRANAAYNLTRRIAELLGPPAAGVLLAVVGPSNLLWINALTFALSAGVVALTIPTVPLEQPLDAIGGIRGYFLDVVEGFRFLHGNALLWSMMLAMSIGSLIAEPLYAVILPVYANEELGSAAQLGFIFAALGAGSIVGNLLYVSIESQLSRSAIYLGGFAVRAVCMTVLLTMPPWWVIAIAIFIGAVGLEPVNPLSMSIRQEQTPPGMRGRVFGATGSVMAVAMPVGIVVYGYLMSGIGLERTLQLFVALNLALPAVMAMIPALRRIPKGQETRGTKVAL